MSRGKGQFVWFDLVTTDRQASTAFYTQLFGWSVQSKDAGGGQAYEMWANGDVTFGGIDDQKRAGAPSMWLGYIEPGDVDATVARSVGMGGAVTAPAMDLPGHAGRIAVLTDPQGAAFALYASGGQGQADWAPRKDQPGDFEWAELMTTDVQGALGFYGENFNWAGGDVMKMPVGEYHMVTLDGAPVCGFMDKPAKMPASAWAHYVKVDDVQATAARVGELGGAVLDGPTTIPGMVTFAIVSDPTGAVFGVAQSLKK